MNIDYKVKALRKCMEIDISDIDFLRFGMITAKAKLDANDQVSVLIGKAKSLNTALLIVRLPTHNISLAQDLEKNGAILTDTLIYFQKTKVEKYEVKLPSGYEKYSAEQEDSEKIGVIAAESFKGYPGHYHADPRLKQIDCDAVYSSWAKNSCGKNGLATEVIVLKKNTQIAAFATLKILDTTSYEGVLFGVAPEHQGHGLHLALMKLSENWGIENGLEKLITSTQITNLSAQKNWCRVGMEPLNSFYTFHLWMNK